MASDNGKAAIENAERLANLTSDDEDAWEMATLLHRLGTQLRSFKSDLIVNGWTPDKAVAFNIETPVGIQERYLLDEKGSAETPDGEQCKSYGDRIKELEKGIADLWKAASEQELRKQVEKALPEIQEKALEQAKVKAATP